MVYLKKKKEKKLKNIHYCLQNEIKVIWIGIGLYLIKINNIFTEVIYSYSPNNLWKGISSLFGNKIKNSKDYIDMNINIFSTKKVKDLL